MIFHVLTIILIVLKLVGVISLSWWLVVAPSLAAFVIVLLFLVLAWRIAVSYS